MLVANFTTQVPTMGNTRTYEDFYKFLGVKPARLGIVANLYPQNTAEYLTTSLKMLFIITLRVVTSSSV